MSTPHPDGWLGDPKEVHEVDPDLVVAGGNINSKSEAGGATPSGAPKVETTSSEAPAINTGSEAAAVAPEESGAAPEAVKTTAQEESGVAETDATAATTTASSTTLIGTVKSYLGFGGEGSTATTTTTTTEETTEHHEETSGQGSQQGVAGAAVSYVASTVTVAATAVQDRVGVPATTKEGQEEAVASEEASSTTAASTTASAQQFINNTAERVKQVAAPYATESGDPAEAVAGTDSSTSEATGAAGESGESAGKSGKPLENKGAIPTAGGERLGEKHWGESDIVPDVPKLQEEGTSEGGAGVSSAAGQPTDEVKANTASNTGSAIEPPQGKDPNAAAAAAVSGDDNKVEGTHEKEKFMDKLKDKLHIGKKDKA